MTAEITDTGYTFRGGHAYTFVARVNCNSIRRIEASGNSLEAMRANIIGALNSLNMNTDVLPVEGSEGTFYDTLQARINVAPNVDIGIVGMGNLILQGFNRANGTSLAPRDFCHPSLSDEWYTGLGLGALLAKNQVVVEPVSLGRNMEPPTAGSGIVGTVSNLASTTRSTDPNREGNSPLQNSLNRVVGPDVTLVLIGVGVLAGVAVVAIAAGNIARLVGR